MSVTISAADERDAEQILKLQYLCFQGEAELYGDYTIEPLTESLDAVKAELTRSRVLVARLGAEVVASVRGSVDEDGVAVIGRLIVHPRMQGHGLGGRLLAAVEERLRADGEVRRFQMFTGHLSEHNLRLYRRHGYTPVATHRVDDALTMITLTKSPEAPAYLASA